MRPTRIKQKNQKILEIRLCMQKLSQHYRSYLIIIAAVKNGGESITKPSHYFPQWIHVEMFKKAAQLDQALYKLANKQNYTIPGTQMTSILNVNPSKQGRNSNQNKGHLGFRVYNYSYDSWNTEIIQKLF